MSTDSEPWQPTAEVAATVSKLAIDKINGGLKVILERAEVLMRIPELTTDLMRPNGDIPLHPLFSAAVEYQQGGRKKLPEFVAVCSRFLPSIRKAQARCDQQSAVEDAMAGAVGADQIDAIAIALSDVVRGAEQLAKYQLPSEPPVVERAPDMEENGLRIWFGR